MGRTKRSKLLEPNQDGSYIIRVIDKDAASCVADTTFKGQLRCRHSFCGLIVLQMVCVADGLWDGSDVFEDASY